MKSCKSGQAVGVLRRGVETPRRSGGPRHGVAFHAVVWPSGELGHFATLQGRASPRRSHCSQHGQLLCFGFVLLFRCSEDSSIGLMRTL